MSEYKQFKALMKDMGIEVSEHKENGHTQVSPDSHCLEPWFVFDDHGRFVGFYDSGYGSFHPREEQPKEKAPRKALGESYDANSDASDPGPTLSEAAGRGNGEKS